MWQALAPNSGKAPRPISCQNLFPRRDLWGLLGCVASSSHFQLNQRSSPINATHIFIFLLTGSTWNIFRSSRRLTVSFIDLSHILGAPLLPHVYVCGLGPKIMALFSIFWICLTKRVGDSINFPARAWDPSEWQINYGRELFISVVNGVNSRRNNDTVGIGGV